jgi:fatty-acyl-CoA synthase
VDISHWIERHAAFTPQRTALRFDGADLTYADFAERIERARRILAELGVGNGDRVAF